MNCMKELFISLLVAVAYISATSAENFKVVCYIESQANHRAGDGKFVIENIDPNLCTHLIYAMAKLDNNQIAALDPYLDLKKNWGLDAYGRFNGLKKLNPKLKTLISIVEWEDHTTFSDMAANADSRATFVKSAVDFCQEHEFDGLDVHWRDPETPEDKANFVTLLKELKEAFAPHGLLLTAGVSADKDTIDTAYDIPNVAKYLDFINVMAYDFFSSENHTVHHAPLYARDGEPESDKVFNVDYAITYWNKQGAPLEKIILGMAFYGWSFTLVDPDSNGIGAPITGVGSPGPLSDYDNGILEYHEICLNVKNEGWTEKFVPQVEAPYAHHGNQWVGYDNKKSIEIKVDYIIKKGLGGGMVDNLIMDDFRGNCFGEKYPLLTAVSKKLKDVERQTPDQGL